MFNKVLIANRGEIAVRVIRACRELGIQTVAVYSDVDRAALHVRYAGEAYHIGPPPARDSYLRIDRILNVAARSGADAVHPGYGFLAERPDFAQAVIDAGLVWIGPPATAIGAMGDKVTARKTVEAAGVPIVPGTELDLHDDALSIAADFVGFPLLIKATAGGGGKGMRLVERQEDFENALHGARREADAAFGDSAVYLEKVIEEARHVEVQLLGDQHGNVIHLGERECSIQRRHQKLIEEAPSRAVDEALRQRMGEIAVRAAEAINYSNAGTIEFLLDKDKNFYFLEMNTRLQVEHPVTELVTGVDIVKAQIRIARGRKLPLNQEDVHINGWAIECRINAEDPYNNFLPSIGTVDDITLPTGPGVRVDTGVYKGFKITPYYDPLVSKLICWGETRAEALLRMRRALEEYCIMGIKTNIPFHQRILDSHRFMGGQFDTTFVEQRFSLREDLPPERARIAAIIATLVAHQENKRAGQLIRASGGAPGEAGERSRWKWGVRRHLGV
jgi:acetyl-CoA carboxylase biotin carboxylase subunit